MPWTGIRSNGPSFVKAIALAALFASSLVRAEDGPGQNPSADAAGPNAVTNSDDVPDIRARQYAVQVVKRSNSNRTYLFEDSTEARPAVGRILLLKREGENIMAFRILKTYPEAKRFAGKRVRRYGDHRILGSGENFLGLEKVSDIAPPPNSAQDNADLKELEGGAPAGGAAPLEGGPAPEPGAALPDTVAYDPELDAGSSPPPEGAVDSEDAKSPIDEEDDAMQIQIDEVLPMDVNNHWLSAEFGFFRNSTPQGGIFYPAGGGFRYGLTLGRMIFIRKAHVQDSLVAEAGIFLYKVLNYAADNDAYSVMPLVGTARYNILLSENLGVFFYGGVTQNRVVSSANGSDEGKATLSSTVLSAGGGAILRVGPNWEARVDLGIDIIGAGLMLRF